MASTRPAAHTGNSALFIILALAYLGLLILFGIQTWLFVDWLFPSDQLLMKILTVISFDFMAVLWASLESFYIFVDRASHSLVKWAWGFTFLLSLIASVLYMVLQSMFRFHIGVSQDLINLAYGITITALVFNIICITFFIRHEWMIRHPRLYEYEPVAIYEPPVTVSMQAQAALPSPELDTEPLQNAARPGRESSDYEHAMHVYLYQRLGLMPPTWKEERKWKSYIKNNPPKEEVMEQVRAKFVQ
jgi:hypothetical protein